MSRQPAQSSEGECQRERSGTARGFYEDHVKSRDGVEVLHWKLRVTCVALRARARRGIPVGIVQVEQCQWDPLESTCRHASLSIL